MFKRLFLGIAVAYGVYGVSAMDSELQQWKEWTPMVGGMPFPTMAIDETEEHPEPAELSKYHKTRKSLGYRCFMPKNQEEMDLLYNAYKAGVFVPDLDSTSQRDKAGWSEILYSIGDEISVRCSTGDKYHINKLLDHFEWFVDCAVDYHDKEFIGTRLFSVNDGLSYRLSRCCPRLDASDPEKSKNIIHVLERLDRVREKIGGEPNLLSTALFLVDFFGSDNGRDALKSFEDYIKTYGFKFDSFAD